MPTKIGGYYVDGVKVPSVTTIIGRFKESGGLIHWAWKLGTEGKDYRQVRDEAASIGTAAHQLVENHINGRDVTYTTDKAFEAFSNYLSWERQTKLQIVTTELSLISKTHLFGGTLDAIGSMDNSLCLLDWKTSNSLYQDYLIQLAAYIGLWNENNYEQIQVAHLLKFSKDEGDFSHHCFKDVSDGWEAFLLMRRLYDLDAKLKKRIK